MISIAATPPGTSGAAGQEALLYPVMLMAEIEVGRITMLMGLYPVTGDSLRLTLCEDIFPAMATNNEFTGEAFDFRLHFKLIIKNDVEPTTASPEVSGETMHAPAVFWSITPATTSMATSSCLLAWILAKTSPLLSPRRAAPHRLPRNSNRKSRPNGPKASNRLNTIF